MLYEQHGNIHVQNTDHLYCIIWQARKKIVDRGAQLGVDFDAEVAKLREAADWDAELQVVQNVNLQLPSYYTTSFLAYCKGYLCWEASLEVRCFDLYYIFTATLNRGLPS